MTLFNTPGNESLFRRFYNARWYIPQQPEPIQGLVGPFTNSSEQVGTPAETLVTLVEQMSALFYEHCDFIATILQEDFSNKRDKSVQMVEFYNTCWRSYSASLQKLDEELAGVSAVINKVYSQLEKDDDKEDVAFSFLKQATQTWRYRVYKRLQKPLLKASEFTVK